ncbi:hypothetical protein BLA14095_00166 [Burkholderia lata]|nr:hypothetical protein BLA14095_00166 [Burkholderia lata]
MAGLVHFPGLRVRAQPNASTRGANVFDRLPT